MPKILKQMNSESDAAHAKRVKDYFILISDEQFTGIGHLIDPEDPDQQHFLMFYNEMTK